MVLLVVLLPAGDLQLGSVLVLHDPRTLIGQIPSALQSEGQRSLLGLSEQSQPDLQSVLLSSSISQCSAEFLLLSLLY